METLEKCKCQHCDQSIEFESYDDGISVACPWCGLNTVLVIIRKNTSPRVQTPSSQVLKVVVAIILLVAAVLIWKWRVDSLTNALTTVP